MDISERKRIEKKLIEIKPIESHSQIAEAIFNTVHEPMLLLDVDLRVVSANRAFYSTFQVAPDSTLGQLLYDLGNRQWDIPALHKLLEEILPFKKESHDYEVTHQFELIGRHTMRLNARRIFSEPGRSELILLAIEDIIPEQTPPRILEQNHDPQG